MATTSVEFLRHVRLFQELDDHILREIAIAAVEQSWAPGEEIVRQGDTGIGVFIVRSGKVEIIQERGGHTDKIRELGPGDVFGDMALLDEFPRSATVRALEPTTCLGITRWHFRGILVSHPQIALALLPVLTRRLRDAEAQHQHEVAATH